MLLGDNQFWGLIAVVNGLFHATGLTEPEPSERLSKMEAYFQRNCLALRTELEPVISRCDLPNWLFRPGGS